VKVEVCRVSNVERSTFERCAVASGLLTQRQLDEAREAVRWSEGDEPELDVPPSDQRLADRLVEKGSLNAWQAKQLLDGRTKFNLGPYLIIDSIGQGGMGQVFKARHEKFWRIVAVKVLPRDKCTPEAVANFTREIRALASLDHPKLVSALDAGEDGNVHYLVTEYVPGTDLRKLVRREGPLGMSAAASIICQVAEGLEYAHAQGIVHRDVKPGNVLVSPQGEAKLSDLGLSGPLTGEVETDPRYGKIVGTADYLSPDHVRDPWSPTPAWDIYSLGCTLYYAVTGKVPFPGGTTGDKVRAHCELRPLDPRRLNPRLSVKFVEVMADMMTKEPAQRIASAREVIVRLTPFLPGQSGSLPASPPVVARRAAAMPAVPPPLNAARRSTPDVALADTKTDFPGVPAEGIDEDSSSSEVLDTFGPTGSGEDDLKSPMSVHGDLMAVLWPLTVFLLAPLALVGAVLLLLHVARTFWF
jgi:eukaryotic-like serine/threonine-protein kinase